MLDVIELIELAIVCAIAFVLRIVPLRSNRWYGGDSFYHMLVAREIKKNRALPKTDPGLIPENGYTYPPLLHMLISPFAFRREKAALRYFSPLLDVLTVIAVYEMSALFCIHPIWAALIYALSPMNVIDAATLSTRALSNFLLTVTMLLLMTLLSSMTAIVFILLILVESLLLISQKMVVQVIIPVHIAVAVFYPMIQSGAHLTISDIGLLLLALPASILVATAITRGRYLRSILPDHIRFLREHLRHGDLHNAEKKIPNPITLIKNNPLSYFAPFAGVALIVWQTSAFQGMAIVFWSIVIFIFAQFWIWGDSWRYLQLGTAPAAVILVLLVEYLDGAGSIQNIGLILMLGLIVGLGLITALQMKRMNRDRRNEKTAGAIGRLPDEWKKRLSEASFHTNANSYLLPYLLGGRMLAGGPSAKGMEQSFRLLEAQKKGLKETVRFAREDLKSAPDFVLIFKSQPSQSVDGLDKLFETDDIAIFTSASR